MISTISHLGIGAGIIAVGAVGHELTHALVGRLLGGRVLDVDLVNLHVDMQMPSDITKRLMLLAPGIVGVALSPLLLWLWTSSSSLSIKGAVSIAWIVYTLNGGTNGELSLRETKQTAT